MTRPSRSHAYQFRPSVPVLPGRRRALVALLGAFMAGCASAVERAVEQVATVLPAPTPLPTPGVTALPDPTSTIVPQPTGTPLPFADGLAEMGFVTPLTLQHVMPGAAALLYELEAPAPGALLVYEPLDGAGLQGVLPLDAQGLRGPVRIEGLEVGRSYRVRLGIPGPDGVYRMPGLLGQPWPELVMHIPVPDAPLRVAVLGDSGFAEDATFRLVEQLAAHDLDFVIHTGDVVYNVFEQASGAEAFAVKFYRPFAPLLRRMPVYPVVGNHDIEPATRDANGLPFYYRAFPPFTADPAFLPSDYQGRSQWYAFSHGPFQFLMLDTQALFGEAGGAEQDAWLAERLADTLFRHTIAAFHVPLISSGRHGPEDSPVVQSRWLPLFRGSSVRLVLSGHDHSYERLEADGITYLVTGGGSAGTYGFGALRPESRVTYRGTHYTLLEIDPARIQVRAVALGGDVIDQAEITLP